MSKQFKFRIELLMKESEKNLVATVPPEVQKLIADWAAEAHITVDQMAETLLARLLGVGVSFEAGGDEELGEQGDDEDSGEGLRAAEESAPWGAC